MKNSSTHSAAFHRILRLRVIGGFLDGTDIEFSDGLNCLIGPRGAGKSTVIELIRFALDVVPGREGDPLRKRIDGIVSNNLNGGRVELDVETRDGIAYKIVRAADEDPMVLDENGNGVSLKTSRLIPADVYSQNQMESIAEKPHYQLDLIDKFAAADLFDIGMDLDRLVEDLRSNTARLLPLLRQRDQIADQVKERGLVEENLKAFAKAGGEDAESINKAHALKSLRDREGRAMGASSDAVKALAMRIKELFGALGGEIPTIFSRDLLEGPNGTAVAEAKTTLENAASEVDAILEDAVGRLRLAHDGIKKLREGLDQKHVAQELEFRKVIEKHKEAQSQSSARAKLEKRRNELLAMERQLVDIGKQIQKLETERTNLMAHLSEKRDERFNARVKVAERLCEELRPAIKIEVRQYGERAEYRALIERAIANAGVKRQVVAGKVCGNVSPAQLYDLVKRQAVRELAQRCELNENQATAVIEEIRKPENLYELEAVEMDDLPSIELNDGGNYKDSALLSTGQKCTAILPILMFDSANPLLIDQPEDNLDNGFVFETVVQTIRKVKSARQLIFVTHNPNIPVLGEAERIVLMQSNGQMASPKAIGDVDACKEHIVSLLEGGEEAFKRRMARYKY